MAEAKGFSAHLIINPTAHPRAFYAGHERRVDVGRLNGRPFQRSL